MLGSGLFGIYLHIITTMMANSQHGFFAGFATFILPGFSEVFWFIRITWLTGDWMNNYNMMVYLAIFLGVVLRVLSVVNYKLEFNHAVAERRADRMAQEHLDSLIAERQELQGQLDAAYADLDNCIAEIKESQEEELIDPRMLPLDEPATRFDSWTTTLDSYLESIKSNTRATNFHPEALEYGWRKAMQPADFVAKGYNKRLADL